MAARKLVVCPACDRPQFQQTTCVACGAALGALRVALRALGLDEQTTLLPGGHPDLLARVAVGGRASPLPEEQWLYQAAPKRRTYRGVMAHGPLSRALSRRLCQAVGGQMWRTQTPQLFS